jgi:hypothetical protein
MAHGYDITCLFAVLFWHMIYDWLPASLFSLGGLIVVCYMFQLEDTGAYAQAHSRFEST